MPVLLPTAPYRLCHRSLPSSRPRLVLAALIDVPLVLPNVVSGFPCRAASDVEARLGDLYPQGARLVGRFPTSLSWRSA